MNLSDFQKAVLIRGGAEMKEGEATKVLADATRDWLAPVEGERSPLDAEIEGAARALAMMRAQAVMLFATISALPPDMQADIVEHGRRVTAMARQGAEATARGTGELPPVRP